MSLEIELLKMRHARFIVCAQLCVAEANRETARGEWRSDHSRAVGECLDEAWKCEQAMQALIDQQQGGQP